MDIRVQAEYGYYGDEGFMSLGCFNLHNVLDWKIRTNKPCTIRLHAMLTAEKGVKSRMYTVVITEDIFRNKYTLLKTIDFMLHELVEEYVNTLVIPIINEE